MKTISISKWVFDVDIEKTLEHSKTIERCYCLPCQNFRKQIVNYNAKLNDFLMLFGVDITRPEELEWLAQSNEKVLENRYLIFFD